MKKILTEKFSIRLLVLGIILLITAIIVFIWNDWDFSISNKIQSDKIGQLGDIIGGLIGSIWALAGVILFYVALKEQREDFSTNRDVLKTQTEALNQQIKEFELQRVELEETKKVFTEQSTTLKIQRFENTFFQLINLHHEIIDKLNYEVKALGTSLNTFEKRSVFIWAIEEINKNLINENSILNIEKSGLIIYKNDPPESFEIAEQNLIKSYKKFYFDTSNQLLSHYFRNIYHIFKFIYLSDLIDENKKQFYTSLLRSQLSSDEFILIAYNSLVPELGYPNFLFLIKEFDILHNFDFSLIYIYEYHKEIFESKTENVKHTFTN